MEPRGLSRGIDMVPGVLSRGIDRDLASCPGR